MLLTEQMDGVEHRLKPVRVFERQFEVLPQARFIGQRAEKAGIDQRIDEMRMTRQYVGQAWRRPYDKRNKADQFRILPQQREKTAAST